MYRHAYMSINVISFTHVPRENHLMCVCMFIHTHAYINTHLHWVVSNVVSIGTAVKETVLRSPDVDGWQLMDAF